MSITIEAALYAADADDDSDPNAITLTATGADADAAWGELRARIASVLGVDSLGDLQDVDADHTDPTAPHDLKRGTIDGHYIEWTEKARARTKAPAKKATNAVELSTKDVAEKVGTDPKTLRTFLRASKDYEACGSGARYSFTAKDIPTMKTRFAKWAKERAAAKAAKAQAAAKAAEEAKAAEVADVDADDDEKAAS